MSLIRGAVRQWRGDPLDPRRYRDLWSFNCELCWRGVPEDEARQRLTAARDQWLAEIEAARLRNEDAEKAALNHELRVEGVAAAAAHRWRAMGWDRDGSDGSGPIIVGEG